MLMWAGFCTTTVDHTLPTVWQVLQVFGVPRKSPST
jgi:hypothetical protein